MMEQHVGIYSFNTDDSLGRGSFAEVFKGSRNDGVEVAVKRIHKSRLKRTSNRNLLESEIAILQELKHPHMVRLFDHIEMSSHICLFMEYCNGGDLMEYINKYAPMNSASVVELARQIASAMKYLRQHQIVHRDLKPQNILVHYPSGSSSEAPLFKFADFGFARHLNLDMAETFCGSPLYMAPEVLKGGQYDARSDLWSIGTILYQCITKRPPYKAKSIESLKKVLAQPHAHTLSFPQETPHDQRDLVSQLLQIEPDNRISFEEFFSHACIAVPCLDRASKIEVSDVPSGAHGVPYGERGATPSPENSIESSGPSMVHVDAVNTGNLGGGSRVGYGSGSGSGSGSGTGSGHRYGDSSSIDDHSFVVLDKHQVFLDDLADGLEHNRLTMGGGDRTPPPLAAQAQLNAAVSKLTGGAWTPTRPEWRRNSPPEPHARGKATAQEVEAFVTTVERATKPASSVMLVARSHSEDGRVSGATAETIQKIEVLKLYNKALTVLRRGMGGLRNALQGRAEILLARRSKEAVQTLRTRFNDCLSEIDHLRKSVPSAKNLSYYRGVSVTPPEELLYQYAINLCPEAAAREKDGDMTTSEVLYSRVLILFNLLLEEAAPDDRVILQQYATSTRRRLETVVENQRHRQPEIPLTKHTPERGERRMQRPYLEHRSASEPLNQPSPPMVERRHEDRRSRRYSGDDSDNPPGGANHDFQSTKFSPSFSGTNGYDRGTSRTCRGGSQNQRDYQKGPSRVSPRQIEEHSHRKMVSRMRESPRGSQEWREKSPHSLDVEFSQRGIRSGDVSNSRAQKSPSGSPASYELRDKLVFQDDTQRRGRRSDVTREFSVSPRPDANPEFGHFSEAVYNSPALMERASLGSAWGPSVYDRDPHHSQSEPTASWRSSPTTRRRNEDFDPSHSRSGPSTYNRLSPPVRRRNDGASGLRNSIRRQAAIASSGASQQGVVSDSSLMNSDPSKGSDWDSRSRSPYPSSTPPVRGIDDYCDLQKSPVIQRVQRCTQCQAAMSPTQQFCGECGSPSPSRVAALNVSCSDHHPRGSVDLPLSGEEEDLRYIDREYVSGPTLRRREFDPAISSRHKSNAHTGHDHDLGRSFEEKSSVDRLNFPSETRTSMLRNRTASDSSAAAQAARRARKAQQRHFLDDESSRCKSQDVDRNEGFIRPRSYTTSNSTNSAKSMPGQLSKSGAYVEPEY